MGRGQGSQGASAVPARGEATGAGGIPCRFVVTAASREAAEEKLHSGLDGCAVSAWVTDTRTTSSGDTHTFYVRVEGEVDPHSDVSAQDQILAELDSFPGEIWVEGE